MKCFSLLSIFLSVNLSAQISFLDSTFADNGVLTFNSGIAYEAVVSTGFQSNGNGILCGRIEGKSSGFNAGILRIQSNGKIDVSFGIEGVAVNPIEDEDFDVTDMLVLQDDKIMVSGIFNYFGGSAYCILKYQADGTLDTTFGSQGIDTLENPNFPGTRMFLSELPDGKVIAVGSNWSHVLFMRYTIDGTRDVSFGTEGWKIQQLSFSHQMETLKSDNQGRIIMGGTHSTSFGEDLLLMRCTSNGDWDNSFGLNGVSIAKVHVNFEDRIKDLVIRDDGKIVVAGYTGDAGRDGLLGRFESDGSIDSSFGIGGFDITTIPGVSSKLTSLVELTNHEVIAGGRIGPDMAVVKYRPDGLKDSLFSTDGILQSSFGLYSYDQIESISLHPTENKILCGGLTIRNLDGLITLNVESNNSDFAVIQLDQSGNIDPSFGYEGKNTFNLVPVYQDCYSILEQPDDKILVVTNGNIITETVLSRILPNGEMDRTFANFGAVHIKNFHTREARSLAIQNDGKVLLQGTVQNNIEIYRFQEDGLIDSTFGVNGIARISGQSIPMTSWLKAKAITVHDDGSIIIGAERTFSDTQSFFVARLTPEGKLDTTFNLTGYSFFSIGEKLDFLQSIHVDSNNKILVSGSSKIENFGPRYFSLARLNTDGSFDMSFGDDGKVETSITDLTSNEGNAIIQPDGRIIGLGGKNSDILVMRFMINGSLDSTFAGDGIVSNADHDFNYATGFDAKVIETGKIIVGGQSDVRQKLFVACFNENGDLNTAFGNEGTIISDLFIDKEESARSLLILNDNKILLAGTKDKLIDAKTLVVKYITPLCVDLPLVSFDQVEPTCYQSNGSLSLELSGTLGNYTYEWSTGSSAASIFDLPSGDYQVTVSSEEGCKIIKQVFLADAAVLEAEILVDHTSCNEQDGKAFFNNLNNIGIQNILWSTGASTDTISNLEGGQYMLTLTDVNDCDLIIDFEIEENKSPVVFLGDDISLIDGQSVELTSSADQNDLTYQWSTGETTPSIVVSVGGTFAVVAKNEEGCSGTDTIVVTIITSVDQIHKDYDVAIYPNPTNGLIWFDLHQNFHWINEVVLTNSLGKVIKTLDWPNGNNHLGIDMTFATTSIYFVILKDAQGTTRQIRKIAKY